MANLNVGPILIQDNSAILSSQSNNIIVGGKPTEEEKWDHLRIALDRTGSTYGKNVPTARGNISRGTCEWIEKIDKYKLWHGGSKPFLWIRGGPGKGKTYLSIHLAKNLHEMAEKPLVLRYFCDHRNSQRSTAHAVFTGLVYQLCDLSDDPNNHKRLDKSILTKFDTWGDDLFSATRRDDLWELFKCMIIKVQTLIYVVLDGFDECDKASIDFLQEKFESLYGASGLEGNQNIRTVIVSRSLEKNIQHATRIDMDEHTEETERDILFFISDRAEKIPAFNNHTIQDPGGLYQLYKLGQLDGLDRLSRMCVVLLDRANGTFLWVAFAMDMLNDDRVDRILKSEYEADKLLPRGLHSIVSRMLLEILEEDEDQTGTKPDDAAKIIHWVSLAFRPLTVAELRTITGIDSRASIRKCKNVLSLPIEISDDTELQLVHLSLKEYLLNPPLVFPSTVGLSLRPYILRPVSYVLKQSALLPFLDYILFMTVLLQLRNLILHYLALSFFTISIFCFALWTHRKSPFSWYLLETLELSLKLCIFSGHEEVLHKNWFLRCLDLMNGKDDQEHIILKKNICNLQSWGALADDVPEEIETPIPSAVQYACCYWVSHLQLAETPHSHSGLVRKFLQEHFLHWLQALSLMKCITNSVIAMGILESLFAGRTDVHALNELVQDARRFVMAHKGAIENSPLQAYTSALFFSPTRSLIRNLFKSKEPDWITIKPAVQEDWDARLQTIEGHTSVVRSVAYSSNSAQLASASDDGTIKLWDASSSTCIRTLKGHNSPVRSVAYSHDSARLASASDDGTVIIWDASSGKCLKRYSNSGCLVTFSHDSTRLATSLGYSVKVWNPSSGKCYLTLEGHEFSITTVAFSHVSPWLASASSDRTVIIWDTSSGGRRLQTLNGDSGAVYAAAFSHDSTQLASASSNGTIKIWDTSSGECLQTLEGHTSVVRSVAYSSNSAQLASASDDGTIKLWDTSSSKCMQTLKGHNSPVRSVAYSHDSARLASASDDGTVIIWDASSDKRLQRPGECNNAVWLAGLSPDLSRLVLASDDGTINLWDASSGECVLTLKGHSKAIGSVTLSSDSAQLASVSYGDGTIKLWDVSSGEGMLTLKGHNGPVRSMTFSGDSARLASGSSDGIVIIWNASSGERLQTLQTLYEYQISSVFKEVQDLAFSHHSIWLASASDTGMIKIWDVRHGICLRTLKGHSFGVSLIAFSSDSAWLASASYDNDCTIKLWNVSSGECMHTLKGHNSPAQSLAFSHDSAWLASALSDGGVVIWDVSGGECLATLSANKACRRIFFSTSDLKLHTNIGTIDISALRSSAPLSCNLELQNPQYQGLALSTDGVRIIYNSRDLMWLPPEYRPSEFVVSGKTISIWDELGRLWIYKVELDKL